MSYNTIDDYIESKNILRDGDILYSIELNSKPFPTWIMKSCKVIKKLDSVFLVEYDDITDSYSPYFEYSMLNKCIYLDVSKAISHLKLLNNGVYKSC